MEDIRNVTKELRRIADVGERIAKALEKRNSIVNISPNIVVNNSEDVEELLKHFMNLKTQ